MKWPKYLVIGQNAPGAMKYLVGATTTAERAIARARRANAERNTNYQNSPRFAVMECKPIAVWTDGEEIS